MPSSLSLFLKESKGWAAAAAAAATDACSHLKNEKPSLYCSLLKKQA